MGKIFERLIMMYCDLNQQELSEKFQFNFKHPFFLISTVCLDPLTIQLAAKNKILFMQLLTKKFVLLGIFVISILTGSISGAQAASETQTGVTVRAEMERNYFAYQAKIMDSNLPFILDSLDEDGEIRASVQTFLPGISFELFSSRLVNISQWCEFIPLHLNIKACGYSSQNDSLQLGFYVGAKGYMTPDESQLLILKVNVQDDEDVLQIGFTASKGPFGSSNYNFDFRAIGADDGVYLEFDLSSRPGLVSSLAKIYFATVASGKVGFSTSSKGRSGKVKYVRGQRGGAERNIVRYLLSIQTYFETIDQEQQSDGYERRLERWFELTQRHEKQLYEMSRETYLDIKIRERANQLLLIEAIKNNVEPDFNTELDNP
jgi:hypothetical protein